MLRVVIGGIVLVFLAWSILADRQVTLDEAAVLAVAAGFFIFGVAMAIHVRAVPDASHVRRFIGMVADNAVTTFCLILLGERGAFVFFVYLFITFGAGFRYGRFDLHACQLMSIVGFFTAWWLSPIWRQHPAIALAFLLSLVVLPLYVGFLADRLKAERVKAEEALKECIERQRHAEQTPPGTG